MPHELPVLELLSGNIRVSGQCGAKALEFIVKEKKCLVLEDGPAYRVAELVAHVRILRLSGPRCGIHRIEPAARASKAVVAAKPVSLKVPAAGSALGDYIDDGPGVAAVFGIEVVGDHSELFRRVRVRRQHAANDSRDGSIVVIDAVQQKVVVAFP